MCVGLGGSKVGNAVGKVIPGPTKKLINATDKLRPEWQKKAVDKVMPNRTKKTMDSAGFGNLLYKGD